MSAAPVIGLPWGLRARLAPKPIVPMTVSAGLADLPWISRTNCKVSTGKPS
jgi:hypothetical protein